MSIVLPYADELQACVDAGSVNLLQGVKAISQILNAEVDLVRVDEHIAELADSMRERDKAVKTILNRFLEEGWRGVGSDDFIEYENSDIAHVLTVRRGIPITNAVVLIVVCEQLELKAAGVNFPGVFLAEIDGQVIDPVNFSMIDYESFRYQIEKRNIEIPATPELANNADILSRMFNNLERVAMQKGDLLLALKFIDYIQVIAPNAWTCHLKRADIWRLIGDLNSTKMELQAAHGLLADSGLKEVKERVERQLRKLERNTKGDEILN